MLYCPCLNINTFLAANIRYSVTLTGIIGFSLARIAYSPTINIRGLRSKALYNSKIILRESMESTCLTNTSSHFPILLAGNLNSQLFRYLLPSLLA